MTSTYHLLQSWIAILPVLCFLFILRVPSWILRRLIWPSLLEPLGIWPFHVIVRKGLPILLITIVATLTYTRVHTVSKLRFCTNITTQNCFESFPSTSSFLDFTSTHLNSGLLDSFIAWIYNVLYFILTYGGSRATELQESDVIPTFMAYRLILNDLLGLVLIHSIIRFCITLHHLQWREIKDSMVSSIFDFCRYNVPVIQRRIQEEEDRFRITMQTSLKDSTWTPTLTLPKYGTDHRSIIQKLTKYSSKENSKWKDGYVSGTVYVADGDHSRLLSDVYQLYSLTNPLHPDVWPSVNQLEAEVCAMTASLLNGGNTNVCGCVSSGGTESIILAVKAHRQYFGYRRGIRHPEIMSCQTAHAGLDKACELLGIRNVRIPIDPKTFQIDHKRIERYITMNTIMIYASAPCYPQGVIDPISELSSIALKHKLGLHVDCCLGGFVLPFAKRLGYPNIPDFDFTLPGVTSMSCDTHKYGYSSKGSSVVLYCSQDLRRAQYFCYADWTGGLYATPTLAGSRPGAMVATAWASLVALGEEGFCVHVRSIMEASRCIAKGIEQIKGLVLLGTPQAMVICFTSFLFNIYSLGDAMNKKGWHLNALQNPPCIHVCVTPHTVKVVDKFLTDLKEMAASIEWDNAKPTGNAAIYGMAASLPPGPVNELLRLYHDVLLTA